MSGGDPHSIQPSLIDKQGRKASNSTLGLENKENVILVIFSSCKMPEAAVKMRSEKDERGSVEMKAISPTLCVCARVHARAHACAPFVHFWGLKVIGRLARWPNAVWLLIAQR